MLIYKITSPTNKVYIGQTTRTLEARKADHYKDYKRPCRLNPLYADMIKYGFKNFKFEVIQENIKSQEELDEAERYWISFYDSCNCDKGYNQDSGGRTGGTKSLETKIKIGETTKAKWVNQETASRMLNGLKKGTETAKQKAAQNFVKCICEYCGKEFYLKPFEAKERRYCSNECCNQDNKQNGKFNAMSEKAAIKIHQGNVDNKKKIKDTILKWCLENKDLVKNCPKNKISTTLSGLFDILYNEYGLKDRRSYYLCFGSKSLKDFLEQLQLSI